MPVFGQPGLVLGRDSLTLDPAGHDTLLVSADTSPTLPVYLTLRSSMPGVASAVVETLLLPARRLTVAPPLPRRVTDPFLYGRLNGPSWRCSWMPEV